MEIAKAIQSYLEAKDIQEQESHKSRKFYLSDTGKCLRVRWLKRKGIETEFAPHVQWIFQIGDLYHDYVYKALESQGILLEAENYVENKHFIGRFDGIVKDKEGKAILEIKSAASYKIAQLLKGQEDSDSIAQTLSYQLLLQEQGQKDIVKSIVLYINKAPSDQVPIAFLEKHYRLTNWRKKQLKDDMKLLVECWEAEKIPPCSCPAWNKPYNSFQPLCEAKEVVIKKFLKEIDKGIKFITTKKVLYRVKDKEREEVITLNDKK